jgi:hypothetical protein
LRQSIQISCAAVLLLGVNLLSVGAQAQKHDPLTEGEVIRLLQGGVSPERVGKLAREYGTTFKVTPAVESDLRDAGANGQLVETLRELAEGKGQEKTTKEPVRTNPAGATGVVLFVTDAPCKLSVDGEDQGTLTPDDPKHMTLSFGEHLIRAVSSEEPTAGVSWTLTVDKPQQQLVQVAMAFRVQAVRDRRAADAARAEAAARKAEEDRKAEEAEIADRPRRSTFTDILGTWSRAFSEEGYKCTGNFAELFVVRPEKQDGEFIWAEISRDLISASPNKQSCRDFWIAHRSMGGVWVWHNRLDRDYRASPVKGLPGGGSDSSDDDRIHWTSATSFEYRSNGQDTKYYTKSGP